MYSNSQGMNFSDDKKNISKLNNIENDLAQDYDDSLLNV